jgi:hypothetical protein
MAALLLMHHADIDAITIAVAGTVSTGQSQKTATSHR